MKMHLDPRNKDDRCRDIGKHGNTGRHILGLITYKTFDNYYSHIAGPEYKIMNIKPQYVKKVGEYQLPPFPKIFQHFLISVTVLHKISFYRGKFHYRGQKKTDHQGKQHTDHYFPVKDKMQDQ